MVRKEKPDAAPAKLSKESLKEALAIFRYLLPYRTKFFAALFALLVSSLLGLVFPYITGQLIDGALRGTGQGFFGDIDHIALVLFTALALQAVLSYYQSLWFVEVGERSLSDLRKETYAKIVALPMSFFAQRRVGELTSRLSADLAQLQETLTLTLAQLLRQATILVGGLILIFYTSIKLTAVMLLSLPLLIALAVYFGRKIRQLSREAQDKLADSSTVVEETLQGIANVKAFANEHYEISRYQRAIGTYLATVLRNARFRSAFFSFIIFGLFGAIILVLWVGARFVQAGEFDCGRANFVYSLHDVCRCCNG
ncbi:MAG: ABC transporter transmembrane domain-containing protein [Chloroherpetonaceae bacterium]|nr:ABC transporter transmembrane domain-containing protein [Chloroherpetonaceae bacterium]